MRLRWVVLLLSLGLSLPGWAQPSAADVREFDSLRTLVYRPGLADTTRVRLGSVACRYLTQLDLDSARRYGERAVALAQRIGFAQGEAHARNNLAASIFYAGDYPAAQRAFEASLKAAQRARSNLFIGHAYLGLGSVSRAFDHDANAMEYYQLARAAYAACQPPNVRGLVLVLHNIANSYLDKEQAAQAAPLVRQALAIAGPEAEVSMKAKLLNLLGVVQSDQQHADSALVTWQRALQLAREAHSASTEAAVLARLSEASLNQGKPAAALRYSRQALQLNRQLGEQRAIADDLHVLAVAMQQLKQPGAFDTLQKYMALRDTLLSQERTEAVAQAQARFDRDGQQVRIQMLEQRQRIAGLEAEQRRTRTRLLLLAGAAVLGTLGLVLARQYQRRRTQHEATLRRQIAADLHDDVGSLLTQISLQSELLSQGVYGPEQQGRYLAHMAEASRTAVRQMSDVVWGLNSSANADDTLATLLERLREHAHDVLPAAGLEIDFVTELGLEAVPLPLASRQALYLIYKEALHNAVKHAKGATEVCIRLHRIGMALWLEVRDNGPAVVEESQGSRGLGGNGLRNMQARAESVGGTVLYNSDGAGFGVV